MSDEQTIYISPDDDLTTLRERLEQIPSHNITLVIPSQTQLRSHVAWKLLYARTRELGKEVLIVSSDPQVRSVAHAVKFRVAHSLETSSNSGRAKSGSRPGTGRSTSSTSRSRPIASSSATATTAKDPMGRRGGTRSSRSTRQPLPEETSTWPKRDSLAHPEPLDSLQSHFDEPDTGKPHEPRPQRFQQPERTERHEDDEERYNQIYDFRIDVSPAIHPLPSSPIEDPDLLFEDYNQAQNIRHAASGSLPTVQKPEDSEPKIIPSGNINTPPIPPTPPNTPANQADQPTAQVPEDDSPFTYIRDDSQPPLQLEQKGEAIILDDEIGLESPFLQKSAISDLPTNRIEYRGDNDDDDFVPPISSTPTAQGRPQSIPFDEEDEKAEERPARPLPRPYSIPANGKRPAIQPPAQETIDEDEDQLPALPEPSAPTYAPQSLPLPMPRARSKPLTYTPQPLPPRTSEPPIQQAPIQKPAGVVPRADQYASTRTGSQAPQSVRSRPAPQQPTPSQSRPARPNSALGTAPRRAATTNRPRRPLRLLLVLVSIVVLFVILFGFAYLNTTSIVKITVKTQDYPQTIIKLTLSDKNQPGTVSVKPMTYTFTKTAPEPATGSKMQTTNNATGIVNFTNTGTASVQIPSQTTIATKNNITFVTTANVLIPPQAPNTIPLPVPIQAADQGAAGNVFPRTITVIPADSLKSIAQAQNPPVTADSLKLTVTNPEATTGGEAHQVPAVTQKDLDNAKKDLEAQAPTDPDIQHWVQEQKKNGLVGQPTVKTDDALKNPPAIDTTEPDKTFSAAIGVTVTLPVALLRDVQTAAVDQLNTKIQTDKQFGPNFAIIGNPQTIRIDLVKQSLGDGNTVTVPATAKVGPKLDIADLQNSIKGKPINEVQTILQQKNQRIQTVVTETQPIIFPWVSPWTDHITVRIAST